MTDPIAQDPGDKPKRLFWTDRKISLVVFLIVAAVLGFEASRFVNAINTRATIDSSAKTLELVEKATSPESVAKAQAQTAKAVGSINETTIIAVYCGNKGGDVATMTVCVQDEYVKLHPPEPAAPAAP